VAVTRIERVTRGL